MSRKTAATRMTKILRQGGDVAEHLLANPATAAMAKIQKAAPRSLFDLHMAGANVTLPRGPEVLAKAMDPTTLGHELTPLIHHPDPAVVNAVVRNPNLPHGAAPIAGAISPRGIKENPAYSMEGIMDPIDPMGVRAGSTDALKTIRKRGLYPRISPEHMDLRFDDPLRGSISTGVTDLHTKRLASKFGDRDILRERQGATTPGHPVIKNWRVARYGEPKPGGSPHAAYGNPHASIVEKEHAKKQDWSTITGPNPGYDRIDAMGTKTADVSGTALAPYQAKTKMPFKELASMKVASPYVDVTHHDPSALMVERDAQRFCLHGPDRYPIDDYLQVKTAAAYFDEHGDKFDLPTRREYAANLYKVAHLMGVELPESVVRYGAPTYASSGHCKLAWEARKEFVTDPTKLAVLEKCASERLETKLNPDEFACLLHAFDKLAGLERLYGKYINDPWTSILGEVKQAEFSEQIGIDTITETDLKHLAEKDPGAVKKMFNDEIADGFRENPVTVYKGLPDEQRALLGRLARTVRSGGPRVS